MPSSDFPPLKKASTSTTWIQDSRIRTISRLRVQLREQKGCVCDAARSKGVLAGKKCTQAADQASPTPPLPYRTLQVGIIDVSEFCRTPPPPIQKQAIQNAVPESRYSRIYALIPLLRARRERFRLAHCGAYAVTSTAPFPPVPC